MNLFIIYLNKIKKILSDLEKKDQIKLSGDLTGLTIELPPANIEGDISCNAPLILSKINEKKTMKMAEFLKVHFEKNFPEFKNIHIAKPGFLNIEFTDDFWKNFLSNLLDNKERYGSDTSSKKKYNIEFDLFRKKKEIKIERR